MTSAPHNDAAPASRPPGLALYVHIPFCETKCPYCDFNTYAGIEALMPAYVDALAHEIAGWGKVLGNPPLRSVFFGGGTPSYLPTRDLTRLMHAIRAAFDLRDDAEVTVEANPGDTVRERLQSMRRAGFNRISIGVQSLDDDELRLLGRRHDANQAMQAIAAAREAGFANVSLDLIFGLPRQMVGSWEHTLRQAIALAPDHLSAYALTLEGGTPMEVDVRVGRLAEPDSDVGAEMYRLAQQLLADAGFAQYEISNWAMPGRKSTHNLAYWRSDTYLGVGPGAHSYLWANGLPALEGMGTAGTRFANLKPPRLYVERAKAWTPGEDHLSAALAAIPTVDDREPLGEATAISDALMMGLRLNAGVSDAAFAARWGRSIAEAVPEPLAECLALGLLEWSGLALRLTERGRPIANEAFQRFVAAAAR